MGKMKKITDGKKYDTETIVEFPKIGDMFFSSEFGMNIRLISEPEVLNVRDFDECYKELYAEAKDENNTLYEITWIAHLEGCGWSADDWEKFEVREME
jgi:hypothetical protein